mmetsp:Transcript_22006/g.46283  ORF Transcript_22006/g.46283 Transcript_22006/m.46283 type:complete len:250 (-) Transcript_22006:1080-1829(-)
MTSINMSNITANIEEIIKIQTFVRGCLCRARVVQIVNELIEEIHAKRKKRAVLEAGTAREDNKEEGDSSTHSIDLPEIMPDNPKRGELLKSSRNESVRDILTKMEGSVSATSTRSWSSKKKAGDKASLNEAPVPPLTTESPAGSIKSPFTSGKLRSNATKHVLSSEEILREQEIRLNEEIQHLLEDIKRVGVSGKPFVNFGELFDDDEVANYYEALVGTLKAAKKKKLISYEGQILLKGVNDEAEIRIL